MDMVRNEDEGLKVERTELDLMYDWWPDNFGSLFDMGCKAFEMLFHHRPQLKSYFAEEWKETETIKKIVLTLEQTLVQCVNTYGDVAAPLNAHDEFLKHLRELGGLHRIILPSLNLDNFELLFKLLPEVIVDMTSARRTDGPIPPEIRKRLFAVWQAACNLMSRQVVLGWERRAVPTIPKFAKAVRIFEERKADPPAASSSAKKLSSGSIKKDSVRKTSAGTPSSSKNPAGQPRQRAESSGATMGLGNEGEKDPSASQSPQHPRNEPLQVHDVDLEMIFK
ncbi:unnamed protein product, partial [Mesorhabditis belari]|uniref:Globin family profile domain-containing protein n=1 Tax=Mesorhabditis belari TaxID=2138241 RepID=A0AAF3EYL1_9BILA